MGVENSAFAVGGVTYPLIADTTRSLLEDADPALYQASVFLTAVLDHYLGARLAAQGLREQLKLAAVRKTIAYEPSPDLLTDYREFPLFALYRKTETQQKQSLAYDRDVGEWEFAYLLPTLSSRQHEVLSPILRSVGRILARAIRLGYDPSYQNGVNVWKAAQIQSARLLRTEYTGYARKDEFTAYYRALRGRIEVVERDMPVVGAYEPFDGADLTQTDEEEILCESSTWPGPTITSVSPSSGTKQGGVSLIVTGTGFRPNTPISIVVGETPCTDAVVLDETHARAVTTAHPAFPDFIADVVVTNDDGQSARKAAAFVFISP